MDKAQKMKKTLENNVEKIAKKIAKLTGLKFNDDVILDGDIDNCIMIYDPQMETNNSERFEELKCIIYALIEKEFPTMEDSMNIDNHGTSCGIYF